MNLLGEFFAYAVSCTTGYALLSRYLDMNGDHDWVLFFLAPGMGLAVTVLFLFLNLYFLDSLSFYFCISQQAILLGFLLTRPRRTGYRRLFRGKVIFLAVLGIGLVLLFLVMLKSPFGTGLDAWAIWKLKARFIFHGPWRQLFSPSLVFSHPDYPIFYPLAVVWGWLVAGKETYAAPQILCFLITLSLVGLLMGVFAKQNLSMAAALGMWMISIPQFIGLGASQYADIFVAYFNLASAMLLSEASMRKNVRYAWVAGFFAGTGTFVKNEGLLFLTVLVFVSVLRVAFGPAEDRSANRRETLALVTGSLPFLSVTVAYKIAAAYPNHMLSFAVVADYISSNALFGRTGLIFSHAVSEIFNENAWVYAWFFILAVFLLYGSCGLSKRNFWVPLTPTLIVSGYFFVYLFTGLDLGWLLQESFGRTLLHVLPLFVWASFVVFFSPEKVYKKSKPRAFSLRG